MAKTKTDIRLRERIKYLIEKLKSSEMSEKEKIEAIAGYVGISQRTAKEHFKAIQGQQKLFDLIGEECAHQWSNYFTSAQGLVRECRLCGLTEKA